VDLRVVTLFGVDLTRTANGAAAGAAAALLWAAQQPVDKRLFASGYDDVELLGKLTTRDAGWPLAGVALHALNGALFGAAYAQLKPFMPGPPVARAMACALAEHAASWPLTRLWDHHHPARRDLPALAGNRRAFAQATWRHLLFGAVLGVVEERLNRRRHEEPPPVPVSSNGHGNIEAAVATA
jgi:hypothetical protein